jgi:hypothetical protein
MKSILLSLVLLCGTAAMAQVKSTSFLTGSYLSGPGQMVQIIDVKFKLDGYDAAPLYADSTTAVAACGLLQMNLVGYTTKDAVSPFAGQPAETAFQFDDREIIQGLKKTNKVISTLACKP